MQGSPGASLSDATPQLGPATGQVRRIGVLAAVAAAVYLADVLSKIVVVATLSDRSPVELVGRLLTLRVTRNPGAAFSIGVGMTVLFTLIAAIVVAVIIRTASRLYSLPWAIALGMLLGGALGNLTDRVFRSPGILRGHVVDFLELPNWPIFNVADSAIVTAGVLMVLLSLLGVPLEGRPAAPAPEPDAEKPDRAGTPDPVSAPGPGTVPNPGTVSSPGGIPSPGTVSSPGTAPNPGTTPNPAVAPDPAGAPNRAGAPGPETNPEPTAAPGPATPPTSANRSGSATAADRQP
ncbi:MAG TPA: signal peptidase II [Actinomycetes bacterium]|nr:signal peptidase II [Actinomycetes bacterium]